MNRVRSRVPTRASVVVFVLALGILAACSSKQRLDQYDFRNRTLGVATIAPPYPEVLSGIRVKLDTDDPIQAVLHTSSEIARGAVAARMQTRLDSAARAVNVSERMGARVLHNSARHLRAQPVTSGNVDYEIEVRVRRYGIVASSWTSGAYFLIDADVWLLDGPTGRRIWKTDVRATDPVRPVVIGMRAADNVVSAVMLATMSTQELQRTLEGLADFAADHVVSQLARSLDDARD